MARKKKKTIPGVDPAFLDKQRASLLRNRRHVLLFNESETAAIDRYCEKFGVKSRSALFREAIMDKVLSELEENHPTLF